MLKGTYDFATATVSALLICALLFPQIARNTGYFFLAWSEGMAWTYRSLWQLCIEIWRHFRAFNYGLSVRMSELKQQAEGWE
jgi:hypothetical protein